MSASNRIGPRGFGSVAGEQAKDRDGAYQSDTDKTLDSSTSSTGGVRVPKAPSFLERGVDSVTVPRTRSVLVIRPSSGTGRALVRHSEGP